MLLCLNPSVFVGGFFLLYLPISIVSPLSEQSWRLAYTKLQFGHRRVRLLLQPAHLSPTLAWACPKLQSIGNTCCGMDSPIGLYRVSLGWSSLLGKEKEGENGGLVMKTYCSPKQPFCVLSFPGCVWILFIDGKLILFFSFHAPAQHLLVFFLFLLTLIKLSLPQPVRLFFLSGILSSPPLLRRWGGEWLWWS